MTPGGRSELLTPHTSQADSRSLHTANWMHALHTTVLMRVPSRSLFEFRLSALGPTSITLWHNGYVTNLTATVGALLLGSCSQVLPLPHLYQKNKQTIRSGLKAATPPTALLNMITIGCCTYIGPYVAHGPQTRTKQLAASAMAGP